MTERVACLPALAEAFREHGYEGASLAVLSSATGLGRGSLYNFFPGGKEEMIAAVLADIDGWFERTVFLRLEQAGHGAAAIRFMMGDVTTYFQAGGRVCLLGWIGLGSSRDGFADRVKGYFSRWISSLAVCLERGVSRRNGLPCWQKRPCRPFRGQSCCRAPWTTNAFSCGSSKRSRLH